MCHNLHLVVKDGLKSAGVLNKVISKASNIVSHIRRSTTASDLLEGENRVQAATSTRWNSQLTMVKSLLSISTEKLKQLDVPQLTSHDRMYLNELVKILTPFEQATLSVQNEKTVSASLVIPVVKNLLNEIDSLSVKFNCSLVRSLKESVQKRLSTFLKCKDFQCVSILDPRLKLEWCKEDEKESMKALLQRLTSAVELDGTPNPERTDEMKPPPTKRCKAEGFAFKRLAQPKQNTTPTPALSEVQKYRELSIQDPDSNPLETWRQYEKDLPRIAKLARKYLCLAASSAPVERLFSVAGKVFRPDRCRMSDKVFESLMMIKCGQK